MADHVSSGGGCGGGGGWRTLTALHRPADQTSPSVDLTEDQDTPRYQSLQPDWWWEQRVLPRQIGIVILLDNNNWSTYPHLQSTLAGMALR